jgi:hypothetical protein
MRDAAAPRVAYVLSLPGRRRFSNAPCFRLLSSLFFYPHRRGTPPRRCFLHCIDRDPGKIPSAQIE